MGTASGGEYSVYNMQSQPEYASPVGLTPTIEALKSVSPVGK
jgi:hypothetical protein